MAVADFATVMHKQWQANEGLKDSKLFLAKLK